MYLQLLTILRKFPGIETAIGRVAADCCTHVQSSLLLGLALSSIGFGAITTFIALLFTNRGWDSAWLAFTTFSLAFVIARVVFGHLPDKIGGAKVAFLNADT